MYSNLGRKHEFLVDGALFDLGVSSYQIDIAERGFSYRFDGALDMRMNRSPSRTVEEEVDITAMNIVNNLSTEELHRILRDFGGELRSQIIAQEIVLSRPLVTTKELRDAICAVTPPKHQMKTLSRCFQALRISVNDEMKCLEKALDAVHGILKSNGRLVVLSYHSLEDRVIKNLFLHSNLITSQPNNRFSSAINDGRSEKKENTTPLWRPLFKKPVVPSRQEYKANIRCRSAKLRAAEKI